MSELEFLQLMSFLGTVYSKEYTKEKILVWVDKGIISEWFQEDMKDYMTNNKITTIDIKYLS